MATEESDFEKIENEIEKQISGSDEEAQMETESNTIDDSQMKTSSSLQLILASIAQERSRDHHVQNPINEAADTADSDGNNEDTGFVFVARNTFWTSLFERYFLLAPADDQKDDMLFYVTKKTSDKSQMPKTELVVHRKSSKSLPSLDNPDIDWEETVYLNLILQHFEYQITVCVCSRTGDQELQILSKCTQLVYATPSHRDMATKGAGETMAYPNIFFSVDNFEEAFADLVVRDSEMVCVELVARDRHGPFSGVIFLGSVRYAALKQVYDKRASMSSKMASRMSMGWFKGHKRVEYMRMRGPHGKGHAEMAISRVKGSGPDTPAQTPVQTPTHENLPLDDFEQDDGSFDKRRMSDPNQSWSGFWRGGSFRGKGIRKSRSETENVDSMATGCNEVEANDLEDEFDESAIQYNGFFGRNFGQAWGWFKERRRLNCVHLHSFLTYISLPWHRIIGDVTEENGPLLQAVLARSAPGSRCTL